MSETKDGALLRVDGLRARIDDREILKGLSLEVRNSSAQLEHEASVSKIGEDQIFYCQQRGISAEDAVSMIVNGFCKAVFRELPMEFAVEAQKLLGVSLEGSVG